MQKLTSKKGIKLPKAPEAVIYCHVEIEPLEGKQEGLYRVRSGKFKGIINEIQLSELKEQIALEEKEEKELAEANALIEKQREELLVKAEARKKELCVNTPQELKTILDEMGVGYYSDAKESELIELIVKNELNGVQRAQKEQKWGVTVDEFMAAMPEVPSEEPETVIPVTEAQPELTDEEKAKIASEAVPCNPEDCQDCGETECVNNETEESNTAAQKPQAGRPGRRPAQKPQEENKQAVING